MAKPQVNVTPQRKGTNVITGPVRLAYQSLLTPRLPPPQIVNGQVVQGDPKYVAVLLIDPADKPLLEMLKGAMKEAATEFFGPKLPSGMKNPLRPGDEKAAEYPFYGGMLYISANSKFKPGVVNQANKAATEDEIYSGCWVRAELNAAGYDRNGNKGVSFFVNNVQKLGDDERFGGRRPAEQVFQPVVDAANPFKQDEAAADEDEMFN